MFEAAGANEKTVETALNSFVIGSREVSALTPGADRKIRSVMTEALGNVRADNLLSSISPQERRATLDLLRWMDPETIANVLSSEHPQVGAVVISVLTSDAAATALSSLNTNRQADLLYRAARLQSVRTEAVADLEIVLAQAEKARERSASLVLGGQGDVAKIVNSLNRPAGEEVLRLMRKKDKHLAAAIEDEMFVFEDLNKLDAKSLGAVLRMVESTTLALALKGAESAMSDRFLATMSARAADTIRDELAEMAPVKREDVELARKSIIAVARSLATSGEIMLGDKGDDYV